MPFIVGRINHLNFNHVISFQFVATVVRYTFGYTSLNTIHDLNKSGKYYFMCLQGTFGTQIETQLGKQTHLETHNRNFYMQSYIVFQVRNELISTLIIKKLLVGGDNNVFVQLSNKYILHSYINLQWMQNIGQWQKIEVNYFYVC